MRKIIAICLGAGMVLAAGPLSVRAVSPDAKPLRGRVLILENERTLTGDVEQVGEQFRVKRLVGETWVPAERVLRVCASLEEAYRFLQGRANLHDPDERLRLADWCRQHGLIEQAHAELTAAERYRPGDGRIRRQLAALEQARTREPARSAPLPPGKPVPAVDVTAESLGMFASKVQPILMNACLRCHTAERGGQFHLTRVSSPGLGNRRSLEQNLAAVLAEVNTHRPLASRLLGKAVSVHGTGMTQAPLRSRTAPAYRTLEAWVQMTLDSNPHLRDQAVASTPFIPPLPTTSHWGEEREAPAAAPPVVPDATPKQQQVSAAPAPPAQNAETAPVAPARPASNDPVDPEGFNREFHPNRKKTEGQGKVP
jgi:hypothetical protein